MKNIGIKLADGTFYPVLKDNVPSEKALKLTTAHNNQTKVMVDLYRSETDSMEDAEYVDSLQIENLVAHPNGEPDIAFSVSLDEENELSARIVDEETGKPFAENGRTLVPLRITMESLGVNVNWNSEKNCIELNKGFKQVVVPFNESYITVNNKRITTDALPVIINDRTYLPIRFVCEAFDYSVNWDQENKVVEIDDFSDLIPEGLDESNATIIDEPINVRTSKRITGKNIAYQVHKGDRVLVKSKIGTWYKILDGSN